VPLCASSRKPILRGPSAFSAPNSSISMRSGSMVAQFTATKALPARRERAWIRRAKSSLPQPGGPEMNTRLLVGAIFSTACRTCAMAEDWPTSSVSSPAFQFQLLHFAFQAGRFQRALNDVNQAVRLERLLDEIVGAFLDRADGGLDGAVTGDHHHRQIGMLALDGIEHLDAVEAAALQPDVEHDDLRPPLAYGIERGFAVRRGAGLVAFVAENSGDQIAKYPLRRRRPGFQTREAIRVCSSVVPFSRRFFCFRGSTRETFAPLPSSAASSRRISPPWSSMTFAHDGKAEAGAFRARRNVWLGEAVAVFGGTTDCVGR